MEREILSISRVNTYLDCQKKYFLGYVKNIKVWNEHLGFGVITHKYLENIDTPKEELIYNMLCAKDEVDEKFRKVREKFGIPSFKEYLPYVKKELIKALNLYFIDYKIISNELEVLDEELGIRGIIDLVLYQPSSKTLYIMDYKTSKKKKTIDDLELDMQLDVYTYLLAKNQHVLEALKDLDITNLKIGYISLPKFYPIEPSVLKNGTLSKAKDQPTTYDIYVAKIKELGQDEANYTEFLEYLKTKRDVEVETINVDKTQIAKIIESFNDYRAMIEFSNTNNIYAEKYTSYCKMCDYFDHCKGNLKEEE